MVWPRKKSISLREPAKYEKWVFGFSKNEIIVEMTAETMVNHSGRIRSALLRPTANKSSASLRWLRVSQWYFF
jgi:hypothetical protein